MLTCNGIAPQEVLFGGHRTKQVKYNDTVVWNNPDLFMGMYVPGTATGVGITVTVDADGLITLNGKTTDKVYIRCTNGVKVANSYTPLIDGIYIVPAQTTATLSVEELGGSIVAPGDFNVVMRAPSGQATYNCQTRKGIFSVTNTFSTPSEMLSLYAIVGTVFDNYQIRAKVKIGG